jgi:nitroimidazol reductase NimA-like FMN-containing flavoprotein (pyridoxamine 5'-phosphate oxidase superfamily)
MPKAKNEMTTREIDQFLTCARVGRLGVIFDGRPYVVPVGYAYADGEISFHTCNSGLKMQALQQNPIVCFEVDESLSDGSMYKSIIIFGKTRILDDPKEMIPYLQLLINKYRISEPFDDYIDKPGRDREAELKAVRICIITPSEITAKRFTKEP